MRKNLVLWFIRAQTYICLIDKIFYLIASFLKNNIFSCIIEGIIMLLDNYQYCPITSADTSTFKQTQFSKPSPRFSIPIQIQYIFHHYPFLIRTDKPVSLAHRNKPSIWLTWSKMLTQCDRIGATCYGANNNLIQKTRKLTALIQG